MTIGEAKIDICMTAVKAVQNCIRDFGAVCKNCKYFDSAYVGYVCTVYFKKVNSEDFCQNFEFRNEQVCLSLYRKIANCKFIGAEDEERNQSTD